MTAHLEMSDGRRVAVRDGVTLGRAPQCDLVLEDSKASRQHARLVVTGTVVEIEDLESSNGTLLNGAPVRRRLLRDGDRIQIGTTTIRFVAPSDGVRAPEPPSPKPPSPRPPSPKPVVSKPPSREPPPLEPPVPDDPYQPGGGLEGDPFAARDPAPRPAADVDVIEFVDEVVEVTRRAPKEAAAPPPAAKAAPAAPRSGGAARQHGVLRFSKQTESKGALGDDLRQMSSGRRALVVLLCLAAAVALGYGAMRLAALV